VDVARNKATAPGRDQTAVRVRNPESGRSWRGKPAQRSPERIRRKGNEPQGRCRICPAARLARSTSVDRGRHIGPLKDQATPGKPSPPKSPRGVPRWTTDNAVATVAAKSEVALRSKTTLGWPKSSVKLNGSGSQSPSHRNDRAPSGFRRGRLPVGPTESLELFGTGTHEGAPSHGSAQHPKATGSGETQHPSPNGQRQPNAWHAKRTSRPHGNCPAHEPEGRQLRNGTGRLRLGPAVVPCRGAKGHGCRANGINNLRGNPELDSASNPTVERPHGCSSFPS
jgi:hypothetical protein